MFCHFLRSSRLRRVYHVRDGIGELSTAVIVMRIDAEKNDLHQ